MALAWLALALAVTGLLYVGLRWFAAAPAGDVAQALRAFTAAFGALASTGLLFTGRLGLALVTLAATAAAIRSVLASRRGADPLGEEPATGTEEGAAVETDLLSMRLDRRTGRVDGLVRRGPRAGARLSRLGLEALTGLLEEARRDDPPSVDLLLAYLDRDRPGWRGRGGAGGSGAGGSGAGPDAATPGGGGGMDEATALEILGLQPGASPEEVRLAHRRLMARLHPDQGGSTFLASQINQAKDVLLGRGRRGGSGGDGSR